MQELRIQGLVCQLRALQLAFKFYLVTASHLGQPILVCVQVPRFETAVVIRVTLGRNHRCVTLLPMRLVRRLDTCDCFVAAISQRLILAAADRSLVGLCLRGVPGLILFLGSFLLELNGLFRLLKLVLIKSLVTNLKTVFECLLHAVDRFLASLNTVLLLYNHSVARALLLCFAGRFLVNRFELGRLNRVSVIPLGIFRRRIVSF